MHKTTESKFLLEDSKNLYEIKQEVCKTLNFVPQTSYFHDVFTPSFPILIYVTPDSNRLPFACYTYELADSLESIKEGISIIWDCVSSGGGIGLDFSNIREKGSLIADNKKLTSRGIIPFIKVFESVMNTSIGIGSRKGCGCAYLDIQHPEIRDFLNLRRNMGDKEMRTHNLQTAVRISDNFMSHVILNKDIDLISPKTKEGVETVSARDLFSELIKCRIETGSPYILFNDTATRKAVEDGYLKLGERISVSNLCTEICIKTRSVDNEPELGVCCLGSVNANEFNKHVKTTEDSLDLINDILKFFDKVFVFTKDRLETKERLKPLKKLFEPCLRDRNIGVGILGFVEAYDKDNTIKQRLLDFYRKLNIAKNDYSFKQATSIAPTATISRLNNTSAALESFPMKNYFDHMGEHQSFKEHDLQNYPYQFDMDQREYIDLVSEFQKETNQSISCTLHYTHPMDFSTIVRDHIYAWQKSLKTLYYLRTQAENRVMKQKKKCDKENGCTMCSS